MRRTLFEMGFSSPVQGYGPVQPSMGLKFSDISNLFKGVNTPPASAVPIVVPPSAPTILGMDQNTFLMLGAVLLGGGLLIAVLASRKHVSPASTASKK